MDKNRFILITGSTSDIGNSIVKLLSLNYNLILHGRDIEKLLFLKNSLLSDNRIELWVQDLKDINSINDNLRLYLQNKDVNVFGFVHCAGTLKILSIKHFKFEYASEIFNVNFFSAVEIIRLLESKINQNQLSNIIFISAYYSKFGNKGNSIYAASKGALDSLVKSLAIELSPRVRVNSILPGGINTNLTNNIFENSDLLNIHLKDYPMGMGECEDIANMVEFLISDKSKWITGQNYLVDGGRSIL